MLNAAVPLLSALFIVNLACYILRLKSKIKVPRIKMSTPLVDDENVPPEAQFHLKMVGYTNYF